MTHAKIILSVLLGWVFTATTLLGGEEKETPHPTPPEAAAAERLPAPPVVSAKEAKPVFPFQTPPEANGDTKETASAPPTHKEDAPAGASAEGKQDQKLPEPEDKGEKPPHEGETIQIDHSGLPKGSGSSVLKGQSDHRSESESLKAESKSLIPRVPGKSQESEMDHYQKILELARSLRSQKDLEEADQHLWELVESPAPPEIQRAAMLELAGVAVETGKFSKAQTIYSEITRKFPKDPMLPQVLLIQGRLYRDMGMPEMAVTKFFSVTAVALNLNLDRLDYYRSLVLRAQSEIADTYYLQGKYNESIGYFKKLMTLDNIDNERPQFMFKLLKSYVGLGNAVDAIATGQLFVNAFTNSVEVPEVRYMIAQACRKLNRTEDAMRQVFLLLESQEAGISKYPADWAYWQQRTGNEVANKLYSEGDYIGALVVYTKMAAINDHVEWQLPVWYQIGLVYEHLKQPSKASETYNMILSRSDEVKTNAPSPSLTALVDMARWRKDFIGWQTNVNNSTVKLATPMTSASEPAAPANTLKPQSTLN